MRSSAGYSPVGRPSDASCFAVRTHGGPSLARPARAVVLSLLSVLVQPRSGCPSREAIADDQVQWYSVVRVGLLLMNRSWKYCFATCHVKLVERGTFWLLCKAVKGRQHSSFCLFRLLFWRHAGSASAELVFHKVLLVTVEARFGAAPSGSTAHGMWSS